MALSVNRLAIVVGIFSSGVVLTMLGCTMVKKGESTSQPATQTAWWKPAPDNRGGAEIWASSCSHCHNLRSPSTYGPHQWDVALYDMRVRANLTGEEQRKVLAFLKAAS